MYYVFPLFSVNWRTSFGLLFFFFYCSYFVSWVPMMRFNTDKRMEEELIIDLNNLFGAAELSSN